MNRQTLKIILLLIPLIGVVGAYAGGCTPSERTYKFLSFFFQGMPKPGEEKPVRIARGPRHPELKKVKKEEKPKEPAEAAPPPLVEARPDAEKLKTYDEVAAALPKDAAGGIDWVKAIDKGLIIPRVSAEEGGEAQAVLDYEVELIPEGMEMFKVVFSHKVHTTWLACTNCHTEIFQMQKGADPINMEKILAGEFCGRCHGKVAFDVPTGCPRCHAALRPPEPEAKEEAKAEAAAPKKGAAPPAKKFVPGPAEKYKSYEGALSTLPKDAAGGIDWVKALNEKLVVPRGSVEEEGAAQGVMDLDVELVPEGMEMFKALFSHKVHTSWLTCNNCHTEIFQMKKGADPINMEKILAGEFCGRCHGTVAFAVATGCPRCHAALGGQ